MYNEEFVMQTLADNGQFVSTVEKDEALLAIDRLLGLESGDKYETIVMTSKPSGDGSEMVGQVFSGKVKMLHYEGHVDQDDAYWTHNDIVRRINEGTMEYKGLRSDKF